MAITNIERFVRFSDENEVIGYGELSSSSVTKGDSVTLLSGDPFAGFSRTGKKAVIKEILCPLESTPIIMCIGLNYAHHAKEANLPIPTYPVVFTKPADALAGPFENIPIHKDAQSQLDYEGELCVVIGKDVKNTTEAHALDCVLGYTIGNDVSARNFQIPMIVSGGQFGYAKSFDKFAPIGPIIATTAAIPDPQKLVYTTKVNGVLRQQTSTDDMIFTIRQIVAHLSRGTTLRKGTVIMTGTPSGVGLFMEPKGFLKDGDVVSVEVDGIGEISNRIVFE